MKISFRAVLPTPAERQMGMRYTWIPPPMKIDAVSVTGNTRGFTSLTAISRHYGWGSRTINQASIQCNHRQEIVVVESVKPILFLVPRTRGKEDATALTLDLLAVCKAACIKMLHFTHYGMLNGKLPEKEILSILQSLREVCQNAYPKEILWDIDQENMKQMQRLYLDIFPVKNEPYH